VLVHNIATVAAYCGRGVLQTTATVAAYCVRCVLQTTASVAATVAASGVHGRPEPSSIDGRFLGAIMLGICSETAEGEVSICTTTKNIWWSSFTFGKVSE